MMRVRVGFRALFAALVCVGMMGGLVGVAGAQSPPSGDSLPLKTEPDTRVGEVRPNAPGADMRPGALSGGAVVNDAGCRTTQLGANDDSSTPSIGLPFTVNFFGTNYDSLYVNNNGNVTFRDPLSTYRPFQITAATPPIIAVFFADVDTRPAGSQLVSYGSTTYAGRPAFCVNWVDVGYYNSQADRLNSFQLLLVNRNDVGPGNFDIVMNYDKIQWETGSASGGVSAGVGFSAGDNDEDHFFQLRGSLVPGSFLDSNSSTGLVNNNYGTNVSGRYIYPIHNGAHSGPVGGALRASETFGSHNPAVPHSACGHSTAGDPVQIGTGNFYEEFTDFAIPGRVGGLTFTRTYNSGAASTNSLFGYGWSSTFGDSLVTDPVTGAATITQATGARVTFDAVNGIYTPPPRVNATLVKNVDGTWKFSVDHRLDYAFNSAGVLQSITDIDGYKTMITRPDPNRIVVTDSTGRVLTMTLSAGRVASITDPLGRTASFAYNTAGDLLSSTDTRGAVTSFTYGSGHEMLKMTDPRGGVVTNHYDSQLRVDSQTDATGATTTLDYDSIPYSTKVTDPKGNVTVEQYQFGLLVSRTNAYGTLQAATWTYGHDPVSVGCTSITDPNDHTTNMTYDEQGNRLTVTDALGRKTTSTYDALNNPTSVKDSSGVTATMTYDAKGHLTSISVPLVSGSPAATSITTFAYTGQAGDVTGVTDPNGLVTHQSFDGQGNRTSVTDPAGSKSTQTYDAVGRPISVVSPKGNAVGANAANFTTSYGYDTRDNPTSVTDAQGHTTTAAYDLNGNAISATDVNGAVTKTIFDASNRPTKTTRADNTTTKTGYDENGNISVQTDAAGSATTYGYDSLDRKVSTTDPNGRTTRYTYDGASNPTSLASPDGEITSFTYDDANQQTKMSYSDGVTHDVRVRYDELGRRTSMIDGTGASTWRYDSLGRVTRTTDGAGSVVGYGYDLGGRLTAVTYPNGKTVNRGFDAGGRLTSVTDWLGHNTTFGYDANSNLTGRSGPNTVSSNRAYDTLDRLNQISVSKGATSLAKFGYTNDAGGRLTKATTTGVPGAPASKAFSYDKLNQITHADSAAYGYNPADNLILNGGTTQSFDPSGGICWASVSAATGSCAQAPVGADRYDYDGNGNRASVTDPSGESTQFTYDQSNHLTEVASVTNAAKGATVPVFPVSPWWLLPMGAVLVGAWFISRRQSRVVVVRTAAGTTLALLAGTMAGCTQPPVSPPDTVSAAVASYSYNGDGLRVAKTVGDTTTSTTWSMGGLPVQLTDGGDSYVFGPQGVPIERIGAAGVVFIFQDRQGSTRLLTDDTGGVVGSYSYDAWGNTTSHTGNAATPFQYTGQYTDGETGLQYLRARYYDPKTGQFLTVDPIVALTRSAYGYAANNPTNISDPLGLWGWNPVSNIADAGRAVGHAAASTGHYLAEHKEGIAKGVGVAAAVAGLVALTIGTGGAGFIVAGGFLGAESVAAIGTGAAYAAVGLGAVATALDCSTAVDARCVVDAVSTALGGIGMGLGAAGRSAGLAASELAELGLFLRVFGDVGLGTFSLGLGVGGMFVHGDEIC